MILTEEQRNHYKRHIIIPEIGEKGQKKLLDSTILVYCENSDSLRPLAYYLAALGTGSIFCYLKDKRGGDSLFDEVTDLNNDTKIDYLNDRIERDLLQNSKNRNSENEKNSPRDQRNDDENEKDRPRNSYRIVLGNLSFIKSLAAELSSEEFLPTIVSVNGEWRGTLQTFQNEELFKKFIDSLNTDNTDTTDTTDNTDDNMDVKSTAFLANSLSAALCTIEGVKLSLAIGSIKEDMLYYDLLNMEFSQTKSLINLSEFLNEVYTMDLKRLSYAKVLIVGVGGLGCPAAYGMAAAGLNTLGLLDLDEVELSNLNRQILHSFSRIGIPKADSAKFLLKKLKPDINIKTHIIELTKDNAEKIFSEYDLVIAAVDNIPTRYLINDTCFSLNKTFSEAGVLRLDGTATTIVPYEGHCYRCLYPNVDSSKLTDDKGVLGPVPGVMGFIQAAEAVKVLTGLGNTLKNKILLFDSLEIDFNIIDIERNPQCPTCCK